MKKNCHYYCRDINPLETETRKSHKHFNHTYLNIRRENIQIDNTQKQITN